jgi:hypothetical protein
VTTIDFYTHVDDRLAVAARLAAKALAQHGRVRVLTADEADTAALDRLLWMQPATGFLPHCRMDSPIAAETPVIVDHVLEHEGAEVQPLRCPTAVLQPLRAPGESSPPTRPTRPQFASVTASPRAWRLRAHGEGVA